MSDLHSVLEGLTQRAHSKSSLACLVVVKLNDIANFASIPDVLTRFDVLSDVLGSPERTASRLILAETTVHHPP